MGEVYKAKDTRLDRTVAIKVLPSHLAGDSGLRKRFEQEARAVSSLNHPHICILHDVGREDGVDFIVMEYLEGETLAERLKKGALPLDEVLRYGIQITDALDKAHRRGIVHRDLKPANVMLTPSGPKLLDFGLAKMGMADPTSAVSSLSALPTARRLYYRDLASLFRIVRIGRFRSKRTKLRRGDGAMPAFFQDIRYGLRTLVQNRGFTSVSIVTLALGIGANSAIFTLIDATLLQKPQTEDPERILSVYSGREDRPFSSASYPDYVDLRDRNELFSGFATYGRIGVTWNTGEQSETLGGYVVSGS